MSEPNELNLFFLPRDGDHKDVPPKPRPQQGLNQTAPWTRGNWHRGPAWYRRHFRTDALVCAESSPGYTSPSHPEAAQHMAVLIPRARLIYMVRDPLERAISQYAHHRREGSERRPIAEALLDPCSQYMMRSRYYERLMPFLKSFEHGAITVVCQEDLEAEPRSTLHSLFSFLGVEEFWSNELQALHRPLGLENCLWPYEDASSSQSSTMPMSCSTMSGESFHDGRARSDRSTYRTCSGCDDRLALA